MPAEGPAQASLPVPTGAGVTELLAKPSLEQAIYKPKLSSLQMHDKLFASDRHPLSLILFYLAINPCLPRSLLIPADVRAQSGPWAWVSSLGIGTAQSRDFLLILYMGSLLQ